ncbi:hypothetical protein HUE58_03070 [Candidatus Ruthia endofausta]|uniref:Uncharacterized protein n=1 Tax=Candidatus Ruthia endofausta TaxID=2738852 RepID=A0A6N0HP31_9GAMM|nr:hypothetical protein [Candidatus Ruthia endofausta]QKQ24142.1 hypothetical protein HUE58_03070 [Candidatus Ruthia endofausta]
MCYFLSLCFLLLNTCGEKPLNLIPPQSVILVFGDSLTFGKGVSKNNNYPAILSKLTRHKVINVDISGETTQGGLRRLGKVLAKHQPSLRTADFYQQLTDEYQLVFAKDLIKNLLSDQKYKSDLIDFNQLGL